MRTDAWRAPAYLEQEYARALKKVSRNIAEYLIGAADTETDPAVFLRVADQYAKLIEPWANALVARIGGSLWRRNEKTWVSLANEMGLETRQLVEGREVGDVLRFWMSSQILLIKSIPTEAAERVHSIAMQSIYTGQRSSELTAALMDTQGVSEARARLIARTETARAQTTFTQARAEQLGSEGYIWRTANDHDVRTSHKEMDGKFVRWDHMPTLSDGTKCHAGGIYNCRCWPEPVLTDQPKLK